ncbi:hypothetical protein pkur_cds_523 [Pandoravirus kuranda]|uniref:Uncharacterized protein n=1 Tax=Pandoravirus kuranda TaxID=3019033 RepID=A0AA95J3Q2_9VIRU|nr:hypothetical protein pkur_cds_523 [Pandoravirus kuranda]
MDPPDPRDNRALLIQALRARIADPDRGGAPPLHDSDSATLGTITHRASVHLTRAIDIVRTAGHGYARYRSALAHVERLEHGAYMPLLARALCDRPHEHDALVAWLDTLRRLYEAFWQSVAATPSAVPLRGRVLGDPPTPRSVNHWLRAHFGSDAVAAAVPAYAQMDRAGGEGGEAPLGHPREWAAAAGDVVESLWRYAAQGVRRVPDMWPTRRALLWQHGVCAPETLFVLAVAQDIVPEHNGNDDKGDEGRDGQVRDAHTHRGVDGTSGSGTAADARAFRNAPSTDGNGDTNAGAGTMNVDGADGERAEYQSYNNGALFTRTAILYAATRAATTSGDGHVLRVVCHASLVTTTGSQDDPTLSVFTSADAASLLGSLSLPPAVPWSTIEAVQRWLAFLANGGSLGGVARWLLTPRPEPAPDLVARQARAAGDAVRACLDNNVRDEVYLDAVARMQQQQQHHQQGVYDGTTPGIRTAERVDNAVSRAAYAVARAIAAQGRSVVGPVQVVALDACLLDALLIDFWHVRPVRAPSYSGSATSAA